MTGKDLPQENIRALTAAFLLALAAMFLMWAVTSTRGVEVVTDSVDYFGAAVSLSEGRGVDHCTVSGKAAPMTIHSPGYPVFLSVGRFVGMDVKDWARLAGVLLSGVNIFLTVMFAFYLSRRWRGGVLAGLLVLVSPHFWGTGIAALSEPLFFMLTLTALWLLVLFMERGRRSVLVAAGFVAGLGVMTRYAGVAFVAAGALSILLFSPGKRKRRDVLLFCASALAIPSWWVGHNLSFSSRPVGFEFGLFLSSVSGLDRVTDTLSQFISPASVPRLLREAWLLLVAAVLVHYVRKVLLSLENERLRYGLRVLGVFLVVYIVELTLWKLMVNYPQKLETRFLYPFYLTVSIFIPAVFLSAGARTRRWAIVVLALFLLVMAARSVRFFQRYDWRGIGYNAMERLKSGLVSRIRSLPDNIPVYTNDVQAFKFYTGRCVIGIPYSYEDASYLPADEQIREEFLKHKAVAVVFSAKPFEPPALWWALARSAGLRSVHRDAMGEIYMSPGSGEGKRGILP